MVCVPSTMQAAKFFNEQRIEQLLLVDRCTGITFANAKFAYRSVMTFLHIIFPLIFTSTICQIFCLSLLLMLIWCQIVPLWVPFKHAFTLQPHSSTEVTSKIWTLIIPFSGEIQAISCFLWLTAFSLNVNTYPLGSLLTNGNLLHSQKASRNDFHEPLEQAIPLPLHVSLMCPDLSCVHYYQQVPATQAKPG